MTHVTRHHGRHRRRRNPRGQGGRLRDELIVSALDLLAETADPDSVSIRAIARRTGVSATAAYRHFGDRDELVYAAVGRAFEEFLTNLMLEVEKSDDPFERIRLAGQAYRTFAETQPGRYRVLFSNPMPCPEHLLETDDDFEPGKVAFGFLVGLISDCFDAGAPAKDRPGTDPEYVAFQLWAWIHGICDLRIGHPREPWPDAQRMFDDAAATLGIDRPAG